MEKKTDVNGLEKKNSHSQRIRNPNVPRLRAGENLIKTATKVFFFFVWTGVFISDFRMKKVRESEFSPDTNVRVGHLNTSVFLFFYLHVFSVFSLSDFAYRSTSRPFGAVRFCKRNKRCETVRVAKLTK